MKAGQTKLEVGTLVKIKGVKGEDSVLNGLEGKVTHPFAFGCTKKGWIGLWLYENSIYGNHLNIKENEVAVIK